MPPRRPRTAEPVGTTTPTTDGRPQNAEQIVALLAQHTAPTYVLLSGLTTEHTSASLDRATRTTLLALERLRDRDYPGAKFDIELAENTTNSMAIMKAVVKAERTGRFR